MPPLLSKNLVVVRVPKVPAMAMPSSICGTLGGEDDAPQASMSTDVAVNGVIKDQFEISPHFEPQVSVSGEGESKRAKRKKEED
jgi:hypothetical protein